MCAILATLSLSYVESAQAQNRRSVGGAPLQRGMVERNPESLPLPATSGVYGPRLLPGSKAPALPALTAIRGGELKEWPPGVITIVEFWASWCPNCRDRAFQVGDLERRHPGKVREVVIATPDRFGSSEEASRKLAGLASGEDTLGTIGWDSEGSSRAEWLTPARLTWVPSAFVVNAEGVIAWIGHAGDAGEVVSGLLSGEWSIEDALRGYVPRFRDGEWRDDASQRYSRAIRSGTWEEMLQALDDLDLYDPGVAGGTAAESVRWMVGNARSRALPLALVLEKAVWDQDARLLNDTAWYLLNATDPSDDEIAVARRMAERASERSGREDGLIEDTLALSLYLSGERELAIKAQERAIRLIESGPTDSPGAITELRERLRMYNESEPITTRQRKRARDVVGSGQPSR